MGKMMGRASEGEIKQLVLAPFTVVSYSHYKISLCVAF